MYDKKIIRDDPIEIARSKKKEPSPCQVKDPIREVQTISGEIMTRGPSKSLRKAYIREVNSIYYYFPSSKAPRRDDLDISFSERDTIGIKQPHDDPLVIMLRIEEYNIHRILIDNRSLVDILFMPAF